MSRLPLLVVLIVALFPLTACAVNVGNHPTAEETRELKYEHKPDQAIAVQTRNGSVSIVKDTDIEMVAISATIKCQGATLEEAQQRLENTELKIERLENGSLSIQPVFPQSVTKWGGDSANLVIRIPDANGVSVGTSNGGVELIGLAGELVVDTSNGRILVQDHDGPAAVDTSNGRVEMVNINGPVTVETSNGKVKVVLSDEQSGPLNIDTSNGSVTVEVGQAFAGEVAFDTSNGSINIEDPASRISSKDIRKGEGRIVVNDGGDQSVIDTSNGSITFVVAN